jgi:hypothetical protein
MPNAVPQVRDISLSLSLLTCDHVVRALRSAISQADYDKIKSLYGAFGKLKEEFDRAVDVTILTVVRRSGKQLNFFGAIHITDTRTFYNRGIGAPQAVEPGRGGQSPGETQLYGGNAYHTSRRYCRMGDKNRR